MSLSRTSEKVFERAIFKHVIITSEKIVYLLRYSLFFPGDSTVNQVTYLYNVFSQAIDFGKEVCVVSCNISKALDHVWHQGL